LSDAPSIANGALPLALKNTDVFQVQVTKPHTGALIDRNACALVICLDGTGHALCFTTPGDAARVSLALAVLAIEMGASERTVAAGAISTLVRLIAEEAHGNA